jgi:predicted ATP-grasp superfamily ATP-dependent carboligase
MLDSKGRPCILEINPRQSGSVSVSIAAGIPLLDDLICLAKNERDLISNTEYRAGTKVIPYKSLYSFHS